MFVYINGSFVDRAVYEQCTYDGRANLSNDPLLGLVTVHFLTG